jgi:hypothetical protein
VNRDDLLRDLRWLLSEMNALAEKSGCDDAPPMGPIIATGATTLRQIARGQTAVISRRYVTAIISELESDRG